MATKNLLMMSLEDEKIKHVANVISNNSCRKILDYLAEREATESELSEKLKIPISTVHYNLQQLGKAGLVSGEEYHYSEKGREVTHYKLANKYIIIAPKKTAGIKEKLKAILPVAVIVTATAGVIQLTKNFILNGSTELASAKSVVAEKMSQEAAQISSTALANDVAGAMTPTINTPIQQYQNIALWFLFGALFALAVYVILSIIRKKYER